MSVELQTDSLDYAGRVLAITSNTACPSSAMPLFGSVYAWNSTASASSGAPVARMLSTAVECGTLEDTLEAAAAAVENGGPTALLPTSVDVYDTVTLPQAASSVSTATSGQFLETRSSGSSATVAVGARSRSLPLDPLFVTADDVLTVLTPSEGSVVEALQLQALHAAGSPGAFLEGASS